jgi:hypothetical protein
MPDSGRRVPSRKRAGGAPQDDPTRSVAALARAGRHADAIDVAATALRDEGVAARRIHLLDLRAESWIALGQFERAASDAADMVALAGAARSPVDKARAL